jgi:hypothetical protein
VRRQAGAFQNRLAIGPAKANPLNKTVPKKLKSNADTEASVAASKPAKTKAAGKKPTGSASKKSAPRKGTAARKTAVDKQPTGDPSPAVPSDDEIRLRAYFIAESRSRLARPGDAAADWLEAKRQLCAEAGISAE